MLPLVIAGVVGYALGVQKQVKKDASERASQGLPPASYSGGATKDWRALLALKSKGAQASFAPALPAPAPEWSMLPQDGGGDWGPSSIVGAPGGGWW